MCKKLVVQTSRRRRDALASPQCKRRRRSVGPRITSWLVSETSSRLLRGHNSLILPATSTGESAPNPARAGHGLDMGWAARVRLLGEKEGRTAGISNLISHSRLYRTSCPSTRRTQELASCTPSAFYPSPVCIPISPSRPVLSMPSVLASHSGDWEKRVAVDPMN